MDGAETARALLRAYARRAREPAWVTHASAKYGSSLLPPSAARFLGVTSSFTKADKLIQAAKLASVDRIQRSGSFMPNKERDQQQIASMLGVDERRVEIERYYCLIPQKGKENTYITLFNVKPKSSLRGPTLDQKDPTPYAYLTPPSSTSSLWTSLNGSGMFTPNASTSTADSEDDSDSADSEKAAAEEKRRFEEDIRLHFTEAHPETSSVPGATADDPFARFGLSGLEPQPQEQSTIGKLMSNGLFCDDQTLSELMQAYAALPAATTEGWTNLGLIQLNADQSYHLLLQRQSQTTGEKEHAYLGPVKGIPDTTMCSSV